MRRPAALASLTVLAVTPGLLGTVTYTAQQRQIYAFATTNVATVTMTPPAGAQVKTAAGFGPFNDSVSMSVPADSSMSTASASMNSSLNPTSVLVSGGTSGSEQYPFSGSGLAVGHAFSQVDFSLNSPESYLLTLNAVYSAPFAQSIFHARVTLSSLPSATVIADHIFGFSGSATPFSTSGMLPAGSYRYTVVAYGGAGGVNTATGGTTYSSSLFIPAPAAGGLILGALGLAARRRR